MSECEIVDGGCFATVYKHCRTHDCDPSECPKHGDTKMVGLSALSAMMDEWEKSLVDKYIERRCKDL